MKALAVTPKDSASHVFLDGILGWCQHTWSGGTLLSWWSPAGLRRISWKNQLAEHELPQECDCIPMVGEPLQAALDAYGAGDVRALDQVRVDLSGLPAFTRLVLEACRLIQPGRVKTYGQLAIEVGAPNAARGVGQAMARNPIPLVIPCHRVVGSTGGLTGYSGHGGLDTKRRLLRWEQSATTQPGLLGPDFLAG